MSYLQRALDSEIASQRIHSFVRMLLIQTAKPKIVYRTVPLDEQKVVTRINFCVKRVVVQFELSIRHYAELLQISFLPNAIKPTSNIDFSESLEFVLACPKAEIPTRRTNRDAIYFFKILPICYPRVQNDLIN